MSELDQDYNVDGVINIIEYWNTVVKRKRLIAVITVASAIVSIVVSLLLPKIYTASSSVMPPQGDSSLSTSVISNISGGLGGLASGFLGGSSADLWVGILKSRTVNDAIIERFNLREVYKSKTIEDARRTLEGRVTIKKSKEDIVSVQVESKDPVKAAEMANAFIEELDRINKGVVMTSGRRTRDFVEKRLEESKKELTAAENALLRFQKKNKAVKLDEQSKAIIEAIGMVKGQLIAREVERTTLLSFATEENPRAQLLASEIGGLKRRLRELGEGVPGEGGEVNKDIFIPTDRIPDLVFQYTRLLRDAKIQETLFELLTQQYEMARIQEAKDSPTVQVLDLAMTPEKKSKPRRSLIVIFVTFSAFCFSIFLAFFKEYLNKIKAAGA